MRLHALSAVLVHMVAVRCVLQDDHHESTWIRDQGLEQKGTQTNHANIVRRGEERGWGGDGGGVRRSPPRFLQY